jgi:hypothetical protein
MNRFRSLFATASAVSMLALPVAVAAEAPAAGTPAAATRYATSIRFLDFNHIHGYGSTFRVRGQVAVPALGGAVQGVRVKLYRRLDGHPNWHFVATRRTSQDAHPQFRFPVVAKANAGYRVVFEGNARLKPSRDATGTSVHRNVTAKINHRKARLHGRVTPKYGHRAIFLDRRSCATCGWHRVRSQRTGARGTFSFHVGAPRHGRYFWRTSTPPSTRFIASHSGVFTTRLR